VKDFTTGIERIDTVKASADFTLFDPKAKTMDVTEDFIYTPSTEMDKEHPADIYFMAEHNDITLYWMVIAGDSLIDKGMKRVGNEMQHFRFDYKEEYGDEGKARHEIMSDVISKGWIRVRHHRRRNADYWIIEFDNFVKRKKDLQNLISTLILDKGIMYKTDRVIFQGVEDNFQKVYDGFANPDNSVFLFLEGLKKEKVEVIKEYKYFDY
jgi:hypothetical protein